MDVRRATMMGRRRRTGRAETKGTNVDNETAEEPNITTMHAENAPDAARPHSVAVHLLIALAAVILLVTAVNVWVDRAALNTDNWVDASDQLLAEPAVREAISVYVVDQLYTNVDVGAQLGDLLPGDLSGLAGSARLGIAQPGDRCRRSTAGDRSGRRDLVERQPCRPRDDRQHPRGQVAGRGTLDRQRERHARPA